MTTRSIFQRFRVLGFSLLLAASSVLGSAADPQPLFNGVDLTGWEIWVGERGENTKPADLFQVADGMIHTYPIQEPNSSQPFAGIVTERSYSRYVLKLEYRWGEAKFAPRDQMVRDAGVLFHLHEEGNIWPASVECQIQEGDTGDIWAISSRVTSTVQNVIRNYSANGKSVTRGGKDTRFARFHRSYDWEQPGWNQLKIIVDGTTAEFWLNGKKVNAITNMERWDEETGAYIPLTSGRILLQAEGAQLSYRNITIEAL
ncbi:MAG: hypothetical protein SynsKO_34160 [Synoicihabitans sp.]